MRSLISVLELVEGYLYPPQTNSTAGGKTLKISERAVVPPFISRYYHAFSNCTVTASADVTNASDLAVGNTARYYRH